MVTWYSQPYIKILNKHYDILPLNSPNINESTTPESRRRIINAITQGAALRGTFAFYLFKEHLDELDPTLVEKYNQIMKNSFGIYDDENAIAMMLAALAQGHKDAGGSSKVIINEIKVVNPTQFVNYREASLNYLKHLKNQHFQDSYFLEPNHPIIKAIESSQSEDELDKIMIKNLFMDDDGEYDKEDYQKTKDLIKRKYNKINEINESSSSGITIQARAANFPMLVHEIIKGLYELISLQGFKGSKEERQAVADKVDLLKNEPSDIRYGKFIYDALNRIFINSEYNDPRIKEFFFAEVYQLEDDEFIEFIENAINEELTSLQQRWINDTLKDIASDLKADDFDATGLGEIKVNKFPTKSFLKSFNEEVKIAINNNLNEYSEIISKSFLNEYSDKTINTTIERWKKDNSGIDDNLAKQLIQRFDQIKSGLAQKLDIVLLSDELKQGQNYLNIDKYSFDDMVKLIRSLPENPEKVKKDAIGKFVQQDGIDKPTAQSYVARFIVNKDKLKAATQEGLEDEGFTKEEVLNLIPKKLFSNNAYLDPRAWTWQPFEQMLDALFPSQKAAGEEGENFVSTDADKIYDKGGIEIYKGDDVHKCISYNPTNDETKRKKYGWCVTQVGNTNYDYYRFGDKAPTFYFVFDRSKDSSPNNAPFKDQWHAFVIQVTADDKEYIVTGADNRGDTATKDKGWEGVAGIVPADTWAKIKGLKDYFKPISLSPAERGRKFASGKNLSLSEFKELSQDEKILYIQGKGSKNEISPDILKILPQYKINLEGRSTTLANVAMDSRQKFPYSVLKDNEALIKRYAVVSSRHFPNDPLPLPFIKYLDEDTKQKYLEKYDDNLTFEYIEKYFGDKVAENYVEKQLKNLNYLPESATKYIKNDKLKQLFGIYSKLFSSWEFGNNTNISDEQLENSANMPEQTVTPVPLNQKQWVNLQATERKTITGLIEKFNKNTQYLTLIYALPFLIKDGSKKYVLLPKDTNNYQYDSWALMDEQGKTIKDNIPGSTELNGQPLYLGYPDESTDFNRIYDIKDLK